MHKVFLKLGWQIFLLLLAVLLLCAWPIYQWVGQWGLAAVLAAGAVCLTGGLISLIPMTIAISRKADWLAHACLAGGVIRMFTTLFGAILLYLLALDDKQLMIFALSVVSIYVLLLAWETWIALKQIKNFYKNDDTTNNVAVNY